MAKIDISKIKADTLKLIEDISKETKLEGFLESTVTVIEKILNKTVQVIELSLAAFFWFVFFVLKMFFKVVLKTLDTINFVYRRHERLLRHLSLPASALIPITYRITNRSLDDKIPLLKPGMHQVRAMVGGGKSLTSLALAEFCLKEYGFASYLTSPVEKPQLSEDGKYYYVMHRVINPKDYYKDGKKVMNYNAELYPYMHKDERHLEYNPRLNKTREYNSTWIPEHEDELLMRHDGFRVIIKYSQHMRLDSQEMENLTFMHEVQTKKTLTVRNWLNNGKFSFIPVKLRFTTYYIDVDFDGTMKRRRYKKWSLPVTQELLDKFDTHAEKHKHAGLPVDYQRK